MSTQHTVHAPLKTLSHLEWEPLLQQLAERCRGPVAAERALQLTPTRDERALRLTFERLDEARALLDQGLSPPLGQPSDVSPFIQRAQRGGVLDVESLVSVGATLEATHNMRRYLAPLTERYPALSDLGVGLADLQSIAREIQSSVTPQGELSDLASGELGELRRKVETLDVQLKERVGSLLRDEQLGDMLQDDFYTTRDDRYVLPVKSGHKRHVEGIVHGWSSSGATVFIEPQVVVEANNRLMMAQAEVRREVHRILSRLTKRIAERAQELLESSEALIDFDFIFAKATLSRELNASSPILAEEPQLSLTQARHPLLCLAGEEVVPNDIHLGLSSPNAELTSHEDSSALQGAGQALVITGPNAGGKTVVMKTAGVITLMALSGLHIPADEGSIVPLIPAIFSDMGDEQSLGEGHSTFSGHMANLSGILRLLKPNSLVLLDELAIGTDPAQGSALAQATLEHLVAHGGLVFVTTHYEALKLLPKSDARFRNGAVEYDERAESPTYRLQYDTPGTSSALQIARRCGLPEALLARAKRLTGEQRQRLDEVIAELESEATAARLAREEAQATLKRHRDLNASLEIKERKLQDQLKRAIDHERNAAIREARKVRDQARAMRERLKGMSEDARALQEGERELTQLADDLKRLSVEEQLARYPQDLDLKTLELGMRVWVITLDVHAQLSSLPNAKGLCHVSEGFLNIQVHVDTLRAPRDRSQKDRKRKDPTPAQPRKKKATPRATSWEELPPQTPDVTCDVRGKRAEEACEHINAFLDELYGRGRQVAFIIHGHGTGALKRAVREWLPRCEYVDAQRAGLPHEGGDGVTAVRLTTSAL